MTHKLPLDRPENYRAAFSGGCDARLSCWPLSANPFSSDKATEQVLHAAWSEGWTHVNTQWAADAKWPVWQLPPVAEPAA